MTTYSASRQTARVRRSAAAACLLTGLLAGLSPGGSASGSDEPTVTIRSLVSQEVGLYIELRDLFSQQSRLELQPLTRRFLDWAPYRQWRETPAYERYRQGVELIEQIAGGPLVDVMQRTLGVSSAIAVYPRRGDVPQEPTAILVAFRSAEELKETRQLWSRIDPRREEQSEYGDLLITTRQSGGLGQKKPAQYVAELDGILVVANQQHLVKDVVDRWVAIRAKSDDEQPSLNELASFRRLHSQLAENTRVTIFFNPLVWPVQSTPDPRDDPVGHWLHVRYTRCQGVMLGVHAKNGLVLEFHARFPQPLWEISERPARQSARAEGAAPPSTRSTGGRDLLRMRGTLSGPLLATAIRELLRSLPEKDQRDLQRLTVVVSGLLQQLDPVDDVLGQLGPAWELQVRPTSAEVPLAVDLQMGLSPRNPEDSERLQAGLTNLLATLVQAGNTELRVRQPGAGQQVTFSLEQQQRRSFLRVTPILEGLEPGVELTPDRLRLTSDLRTMSPEPSTSLHPQAAAVARSDLEIRVPVNDLRDWMAKSRGPLTKLIVRTQHIAPKEAESRLTRLSRTLELIDRLEVELSVSGADLSGRASLTVVNDP